MRQGSLILATIISLFIINHAVCQGFNDGKKKHFRIDPSVTSGDFEQGVLYVKLKPEYVSDRILINPAGEKSKQIFNYLEISKSKPFANSHQIRKLEAKARKSGPSLYDIRSYHQVYYDHSTLPLEQAVNLLYETGMFEIVEPAWINRMTFQPNDSLLSRQYYLELVKTFEAWDITPGKKETVIAIVDSGIDRDHPDIVNNLWYNEADPVDGIDNDNNGYIDDFRGWDFGGALKNNFNDEDNDPRITKGGSHSHGTGVGGLIGAEVNNRIGLAGIGNQCRVVFTKHMADDMNDDELSLIDTYSGILYAASLGVDVINCSWGSSFRSQIAQDLINLVVEDLDVVVVAAAGNTGQETDDHYPSAYDNVLSVSAVDARLRKSSFTTYGQTVDITAPGSGIAVLQYNDTYGNQQGTSFSSPIVAAAAGLVRSHRPELTAQQVSELLRVTANDTIYEVNTSPSFKNKLGKGILDIQKALIDNPPAVRLRDYLLVDRDGKIPEPGEEGFLVMTFKNFLWPSTGGMRVRLTSKSALLQVLKNEITLGMIEMNQEVTNMADPFRIMIAENVPPNTRVDLLLEFFDGSFYDYQFLSVLLNPSFLNIVENLISSTLAENGRLGFQDTDQVEGLGFVYNDKNILYEMGLILGTANRRIANNVRSTGGNYDNDFFPLERIKEVTPGLYSSAEIVGSFSDSLAGSNASGVEVRYRSMVWKEVPNDKFFIIEYTLFNRSTATLNNFHAGLFADWDISDNGQSDRAGWFEDTSMGYVYTLDTIENNPVYSGIQCLTGNPQYFAIDNDESIDNNPFGIYDGFTDEEKFKTISSGIGRAEAGTGNESGSDVSHSVGTGPFVIAPDDSIVIAFAIHGASSLKELIASSRAADTLYNYTLKAPAPILNDEIACYEDSATIQASGAENYKWYTAKTGGIPFHEGEIYTTGILRQDTTFFVSNADNSWESVRTPANVFLRANPEVSLSGSKSLCDNDTLVLLVEKADTYLWHPGNEITETIRIGEAGVYSVTVTDTTYGCVSTSEEIAVQKFESPQAFFEVDPQEIEKNQDTGIILTDLSINAMNWFWQLSDGNTSNDRNPAFTVNTVMPIKVNLTITADNGCQDTSSVIIDLITSLEDNDLSDSWKIYPNPGEGIFHYQLINDQEGAYRMTFYDPAGKAIENYEFFKSGLVREDLIDLTQFSAGMYIVRLLDPAGKKAFRRIVIR
jgi:serine protease